MVPPARFLRIGLGRFQIYTAMQTARYRFRQKVMPYPPVAQEARPDLRGQLFFALAASTARSCQLG